MTESHFSNTSQPVQVDAFTYDSSYDAASEPDSRTAAEPSSAKPGTAQRAAKAVAAQAVVSAAGKAAGATVARVGGLKGKALAGLVSFAAEAVAPKVVDVAFDVAEQAKTTVLPKMKEQAQKVGSYATETAIPAAKRNAESAAAGASVRLEEMKAHGVPSAEDALKAASSAAGTAAGVIASKVKRVNASRGQAKYNHPNGKQGRPENDFIETENLA